MNFQLSRSTIDYISRKSTEIATMPDGPRKDLAEHVLAAYEKNAIRLFKRETRLRRKQPGSNNQKETAMKIEGAKRLREEHKHQLQCLIQRS